jgi:phenylacetic acid degradation operon negative regulatory protein
MFRVVNDQLRRRAVGAPAARSLLLTLMGEYVLPRGGEGVWQETLIGALGTMDYKTHAARQALARSIGEGWLITERHGRRSRVTLSDGTAKMLASGAERIYGFGDEEAWDGRWLLVVLSVPEERREVRHQLRTQLAWAGFGSLGGGLWISPHTEREAELSDLAGDDSVAELLSFRAEIGTLGRPQEIVRDAWDLDELRDSYAAFNDRFGRLRPKTPDAVFAAQTLLVHEWRKFPFLDPNLPRDLLPARWPGERALEIFRQRHEQWNDTAQDYFTSLEALRTAA